MKRQYQLLPDNASLPSIDLDWDDEKDEYLFTVDATVLPPLSGFQVAALYLSLHTLRNQSAHTATTEGSRPEQAGSPVSDG